MHSVSNVYQIAVSQKVREKAVHDVCRTRHDIHNFALYGVNQAETVDLTYDWIIGYRNAPHVLIPINDGVRRKLRYIIVPTFEELVVQHCVVEALKPMFMRGMYEHSYASIPGRGAHKAKKVIERYIKHHPAKCKYVLKMDIYHFFQSIPHDILKDKLRKAIHDEYMLALLFEIIDVIDSGLPLGFYTSQWLANWFLQGLDHFIKEELHADLYIRYMDDMVIFGSNKKKLHYIRQQIETYLETKLGLHLKGNWQVFRFDYVKDGKHYGRDLDFMGFRFFRNKTILRKSIMLRATRKAKRMSRKAKPTIYDIRQMMSYIGWIDATDTYGMYLKYIKPYVDFGHCKKRVSKYDRRKRRYANSLLSPRGNPSYQAACA